MSHSGAPDDFKPKKFGPQSSKTFSFRGYDLVAVCRVLLTGGSDYKVSEKKNIENLKVKTKKKQIFLSFVEKRTKYKDIIRNFRHFCF